MDLPTIQLMLESFDCVIVLVGVKLEAYISQEDPITAQLWCGSVDGSSSGC